MTPSPVVFLVVTYHQPALAGRLLRRLAMTESALTVVHHDAKATAQRPELPPGGRAVFFPEPWTCTWGDTSLVELTLECMRWIRQEIADFSWIVLVSGQDYPAVATRAIESELLASQTDAFIQWEFVPPFATRHCTDWQRGTSHRYYWHMVPRTHRPIPVPRLRSYRDGIGVHAGCGWWNLSRRAVDRILDQPELLAYLLRRRFRSTILPDEALFQTMLLNSPSGMTLVNDARRFYRFRKAGGAAHPEILTMHDLPAIVESNAFFVRKADESASAELLDALDERADVTSDGTPIGRQTTD